MQANQRLVFDADMREDSNRCQLRIEELYADRCVRYLIEVIDLSIP